MRYTRAAIFVGLAISLTGLTRAAAKKSDSPVSAETVDARVKTGRLGAISDSELTLIGKSGTVKIPLSNLAELRAAAPGNPMTAPGRRVVVKASGLPVTAATVAIAEGKVNLTNSALGAMTYPFDRVAAVYLPEPKKSAADVAARCAELGFERGQQDVVVMAKKTGGWLAMEGVLKSIDKDTVTFEWKGADRKIALSAARAVFLAPTRTSKTRKDEFKGLLTLVDGSSARFVSLACKKGEINAVVLGAGRIKTSVDKLASIRFATDRVVALGAVKPVSVKQHGMLDTTMGWRINRSVSGRAIKMGGRTYSGGIGVHSFCELTYGLKAQYKYLIAVVGIDDAVRPGGDAMITFIGDGKELLPPLRVTGKGKPLSVRIPLSGVKTLIIRVGYGKDSVDVGDHVNLAGARLIK